MQPLTATCPTAQVAAASAAVSASSLPTHSTAAAVGAPAAALTS